MANITKTIPVGVSAEQAWAKISEVGAVDKLIDLIATCSVEGDIRLCTLADGQEIKERIISVDDIAKRLVYTVTDGPIPLDFHCSSVQVLEEATKTSVVWTVDVKPDEVAVPLSSMMDSAAHSMSEALA